MKAFRRVVARNGILRSSFHWKELTEPLQAVHEEGDLPVRTRHQMAFGRQDQIVTSGMRTCSFIHSTVLVAVLLAMAGAADPLHWPSTGYFAVPPFAPSW